jgi:hypothetical protein
MELGLAVGQDPKSAECLTLIDKGLAAWESAANESTKSGDGLVLQLNSQIRRAEKLGQQGRHAEALRDWEKAAELAKNDTEATRDICLVSRSTCLIRLGQVTEAQTGIQEIENAAGDNTELLYDLACFHALSSWAMKAEANLTEVHAGRAMELLRKIQITGYFSNPKRIAHMKLDSDLDPIRLRQDYCDFVRLVEEKAQKKISFFPPF